MIGDGQATRQHGTALDRRSLLAAVGVAATSSIAGCSLLGGLEVEVAESARFDESLSMRVAGAEPGSSVTLEAQMADDEDREWSSQATFEADEEGIVSVSNAAPTDGAYEGAHPMGLVWSMAAEEEAEFFQYETKSEHELTITATVADRSTEASVTLSRADDGVTRHEIEADGIVGEWWEPAADGPHPAVLLLHGSGGRRMSAHAAALASRGYAAMTIQYFGVRGMPSSLVEVPLGYVTGSIDWFLDHDAVAGDSLGVYGVSKGAELALLMASRDDRIAAAISDSGSGYVISGVGSTFEDVPSSWSVDGESIPYLPYTDDAVQRLEVRDGNAMYREVYAAAADEASQAEREAAAIPVEEGSARYLLLSGGDDQLWPAVELSNVAIDRLDAAGYDRPYEHLVYENAGHSIGIPHLPEAWRPASGGLIFGGSQNVGGKATADAWPRILETLDDALR